MRKGSEYSDEKRLEVPRPFRGKYLFVYPFVKTRAWYALPSRRALADHAGAHPRRPRVPRASTTTRPTRFGLDDQEFVVAFDTDDAGAFLDLVQRLRTTEASAYTLRDTPSFTCIAASVERALNALDGEPRRARARRATRERRRSTHLRARRPGARAAARRRVGEPDARRARPRRRPLRRARARDRRPAAVGQRRARDLRAAARALRRRRADAAADPRRRPRASCAPPRACRGRRSRSCARWPSTSSSGELELDRLDELGDDEVIAELVAVKGIGEWSAHMFLMFQLEPAGRPRRSATSGSAARSSAPTGCRTCRAPPS